jgi:hypothetical protein
MITSPDATNNYDIAGADAYAAATGAIAIKKGTVVVTYAGAAALTLAVPTAGIDDGKTLVILDTTGHAHTITTSSNGFNNAHSVLTMSGTAGNTCSLRAWNGQWWVATSSNGTLSA